ncbi:hypothetical protein HOLleu_00066 [Holothuria leucospilota]|uniref:Uncharacterized protein n=1 Tax=Holothuria leucospilota TaxID=206669 RepID=A0A9Q1CP24_HOLLE|nr:hypothetical protein HOLleu_00066 [Holothuria leucospilota]
MALVKNVLLFIKNAPIYLSILIGRSELKSYGTLTDVLGEEMKTHVREVYIGDLMENPLRDIAQDTSTDLLNLIQVDAVYKTRVRTLAHSQLDNIQKKAPRIIGVGDVTTRTKLSIPTLDHRRRVTAVTTLCKMHTSICPTGLKAMLPLR